MALQTAQSKKKTLKKRKFEYDAKVTIQVSIKKKRNFGIGYEVMRRYK